MRAVVCAIAVAAIVGAAFLPGARAQQLGYQPQAQYQRQMQDGLQYRAPESVQPYQSPPQYAPSYLPPGTGSTLEPPAAPQRSPVGCFWTNRCP